MNGSRALERRPELLARERVEALDEQLHSPLKLAGGGAEQLLDPAVKLQSVLLDVPLPHPDPAGIHGQLQPPLRLDLFGHVAHYGENAVGYALFVEHGAVDRLPVALLALMGRGMAAQVQLDPGDAAADDLLEQGLQHGGQGWDDFPQGVAVVLLPGEAVEVGQGLVDAAAAKVAIEDAYAKRGQFEQLLQLVHAQLPRLRRIGHGVEKLFPHHGTP